MNDSTDQFLEQLGNLGSAGSTRPADQADVKPSAGSLPSTDNQDHWRILLVNLVYHLNSSFRDVFYWEGVKTGKDTCQEIVRILYQLGEVPNDDRTVRLSLRGAASARLSEKADYIIRLGEFSVDISGVAAVIKRKGIRLKHLEGRAIKSFEQFAALGIDTVFIKIPDESEKSLESLRISLRIVSCFSHALENETPIKFVKNHESLTVPPILNEFGQPDVNLTQLAALNNLNAANMQQMVQKVSTLMKGTAFSQLGLQPVNVYQAIFHVKSLKEKLIRPPVEMNSEKGAAVAAGKASSPGAGGYGGPAGSGLPGMQPDAAQADGPGAAETFTEPAMTAADTPIDRQGLDISGVAAGLEEESNPQLVKANIARFLKESYGSSTAAAVQAMKTIYSSDYKELDMAGLENRLLQITDLLNIVESRAGDQPIAKAVQEKIQAGLSQVPREFLDDLVVQDDLVKIWDGDQEKVLGKANDSLVDVIEASKKKSADRKRIKIILGSEQHISDLDYAQLAQAFDLAPQESKDILKHFKDCFDSQRNFQRALFERKISDFAGYPKHIFEILWGLLRETPRRRDRLPFLNSLQLLVSKIGQPKQAIKILLTDLLLKPNEISYPDRNALMLVILFLRTYNKEINMDIEITPEEVLMVQVGLDRSIAQYAAWKIKADQNKLVEKMTTIRKKLLAALELAGSDQQIKPVRFLMALEREAHIFLSLVGGDTASAIIRGALNVYGNPAAQIYQLKESEQYFSVLLQHLAILVRGLIRFGEPADLELLDSIKSRRESFTNLAEEPRHAAQVRRTLAWIDNAQLEIKEKHKQ